jgi:UDP-glucose 4-epimerase
VRVLVTGGTGFIGRYVCTALRERGHEPITFGVTKECDILGDIRDATAIDIAVSTCDAVMHLAGVLGTQETVDDPLPAIETNILGGLNVFKAIRRYRVPAANIAAANHWMWNPYSITKKAAERFALMANKEWGTKIALVRGLNVYGPRQKAYPVKKIMPNLILPALEGRPIVIYGDGEQVMDMIWVEDVAEIMVRALLNDHGVYESVMEAGTGRETTVNQLAQMVVEMVGQGEIQHVPMRPGEAEHSIVLGDPRTLAPLKIFPDDLTPLEDGLKRTIASYQ